MLLGESRAHDLHESAVPREGATIDGPDRGKREAAMKITTAQKWKVGDYVRFAHVSPGIERFKIIGITREGMLQLAGMAGEFGPHIFEAETSATPGPDDETAA
jgi:hypothetical protein